MEITYTESRPQERTDNTEHLAIAIADDVLDGKRIEPVKRLFEITGAGLKACHQAVLYLEREERLLSRVEFNQLTEGVLVGLYLACKYPKNAHQTKENN